MRRIIVMLAMTAVEWSLVGDPVEYSLVPTTLPVDRKERPVPTDGLLTELRRADYRRARTAAERDGLSLYSSDGKTGSALPKGLYELIRVDGKVMYRRVEPAGIPIPRPDRDDGAGVKPSLTTEECVGSA